MPMPSESLLRGQSAHDFLPRYISISTVEPHREFLSRIAAIFNRAGRFSIHEARKYQSDLISFHRRKNHHFSPIAIFI